VLVNPNLSAVCVPGQVLWPAKAAAVFVQLRSFSRFISLISPSGVNRSRDRPRRSIVRRSSRQQHVPERPAKTQLARAALLFVWRGRDSLAALVVVLSVSPLHLKWLEPVPCTGRRRAQRETTNAASCKSIGYRPQAASRSGRVRVVAFVHNQCQSSRVFFVTTFDVASSKAVTLRISAYDFFNFAH